MSTEKNEKTSQKDAVVVAVAEVLGEAFTPEVTVAKSILTKEQVATVKAIVTAGIVAGTVVYSKEVDEVAVAKYVAGMVDNHLRKAKELNGGVKYEATTTRGPRKPKETVETKPDVDMSALPPEVIAALS